MRVSLVRFRALAPLAAILAGLLPTAAWADDPAWWSSSGTAIIETGHTPISADNWEIVNLGQLKHVALMARGHLAGILSLTETDWDAAYGGSSENPFRSADFDLLGGIQDDPLNYEPANIGQLKFIAHGFYKILATHAPAYDVLAQLEAMGLDEAETSSIEGVLVPWVAPAAGENWEQFNIGQLKLVFSFDFGALLAGPDSDNDGLPDAWETYYFSNLAQNGSGDANDDGLLNRDAFRFGLNPNTDESVVTGKFDVFTYDARGWLDDVAITGSIPVSYLFDKEGNLELFQ